MADPIDPAQEERNALILRLGREPRLAHQVLFRHRHPQATPAFHDAIIDLWHSPAPRAGCEAFRGAAKSTLAEEAIVTLACFQRFRNCVILGESEARANERLAAIKNEFETNPYIEDLFGSLVGTTWQSGKIVLSNGVCIQSFGRGQSLRGAKHLDARPDLAFGDDMEDEEAILTPEAKEKFKNWFMKVVTPALAPNAKFRVAGTPLDPQCWLLKLKNSEGWQWQTFPIEHFNEDGERTATWPGKFPLTEVDRLKTYYEQMGAAQQFAQEYMCEATDPATRSFTADIIPKPSALIRSWQPTYAMYDPARTTAKTSATTGVAIWSWMKNRLIVWDSYARSWKPDEMVEDVFRVDAEFHPVVIGLEEDGLNEWLMQPLRQEQARRGLPIPIRAMKAPRGKLDFIRGLQPFFKAGEVEFAKRLPELEQQLLSFPTGKIDAPNALAYALKLRPGQPLYDGFSTQHIASDVGLVAGPVWLALNATPALTTAIIVQFVEGALTIATDFVREGDPDHTVPTLLKEAALVAGRPLKLIAPAIHFSEYDRIGLRAAVKRLPATLTKGGALDAGRAELRDLLSRTSQSAPLVQVSTDATWTLRAMTGGYCRSVAKGGLLTEEAEDGAYKVLMEGLEAFAGLLQNPAVSDRDDGRRMAVTPDGRQYTTSRA